MTNKWTSYKEVLTLFPPKITVWDFWGFLKLYDICYLLYLYLFIILYLILYFPSAIWILHIVDFFYIVPQVPKAVFILLCCSNSLRLSLHRKRECNCFRYGAVQQKPLCPSIPGLYLRSNMWEQWRTKHVEP